MVHTVTLRVQVEVMVALVYQEHHVQYKQTPSQLAKLFTSLLLSLHQLTGAGLQHTLCWFALLESLRCTCLCFESWLKNSTYLNSSRLINTVCPHRTSQMALTDSLYTECTGFGYRDGMCEFVWIL